MIVINKLFAKIAFFSETRKKFLYFKKNPYLCISKTSPITYNYETTIYPATPLYQSSWH